MLINKTLIQFLKPYPWLILLTIVLGFSGGLFNGISTALIVPVVLKMVGQEVDLNHAPGIIKTIVLPFDNLAEDYRLLAMSGAILLIIFLKNAASYFSTLSSSALKQALTSDMREAGVKLLLEVDIDYFTKMKLGDLINRLGTEISRAATSINNGIKLIILVVTILVFIIILLSISWQLTIGSTVLLSFVALANQYGISRSKFFGKQLSETAKACTNTIIETLTGIRLVKASGNEDRAYQRIKYLICEQEKAEFESQVNFQLVAPVSEVMGITALLLIVFLSRTFFTHEMTSFSAVILTYLLVLLRLLPLIAQLNTLRSAFANNAASVDIVTDFLHRDNKSFMTQGNLICPKLEKGVHFNYISFAYPNQEKLVVKDVNLYLPRGTTLALVGSSGAGKSTLADLLPRFYDPISGSITWDGVDIRDFAVNSLRKTMGIVSQDTFLFNDSIRNNIAYARPEATDDQIIIAAKQANAYEFIVNLPQGFNTLVGDRGVMLSGGQRQRIAIARALLQNPEILILDEATSALDTVSERLVQAAIDDLSRDRTTLVIAHRLSTVQKAHQIAVLDQGQVVEVGTHNELLEKGGYYSRLYSMQFGQNVEGAPKFSQNFILISYEIRTRLNSMLGCLKLLIDGMVDDEKERQELFEESYKSALRILTGIDVFEETFKLKNKLKLTSIQEYSLRNSLDKSLIQIFEEIRIKINNRLAILTSLADGLVDNYEEQNELITDLYPVALDLFNKLEIVEKIIAKDNSSKIKL